MQIVRNNHRYDIDQVADRAQKSGMAGYNRFTGWILSLFGFAVKIKADNGNFYLNRKSAIHWLNRHGENLPEKTKGSKIRELFKIAAFMPERNPEQPTTPLVHTAPAIPTQGAPEKTAEDLAIEEIQHKKSSCIEYFPQELILPAFNKCKNTDTRYGEFDREEAFSRFFIGWSFKGLENMKYLLAHISLEDLALLIRPSLFDLRFEKNMSCIKDDIWKKFPIGRMLVDQFFKLLTPIQQKRMVEIFQERDWDMTLLSPSLPTAEAVEIFKRYRHNDEQLKKFCEKPDYKDPQKKEKSAQILKAVLAEMTAEEFKKTLDLNFFGEIAPKWLLPYVEGQPEKIALLT